MLKVPKKYLKNLADIKNVLKNAKNKAFFVTGHRRPDGDVIGSMLAVYSLLKRLRKNVFLYNYDPVPSFLRFLPYSEKIKVSKKVEKKFDVSIILECPEVRRFGNIIDIKKQVKNTINIDHHPGNGSQANWADLNWVDAGSASLAEMVFYMFKFLKMPLTKEEAVLLYTGIVTDTHNFRQINTTAQSHIIASELLSCGVEPAEIEKHVYGTRTLNALHLLGAALGNIKTDKTGKIAYTTVKMEDFGKTKASAEDTEEIVNYPGMVPGVFVWLLFREMRSPAGEDLVKVSFRSAKKIDVNRIANKFGGGGHKNAAGCIINGGIDSVIDRVICLVSDELGKDDADR
ncbi:MAG: bifunctional oligoribonuclease/PAP phosphatase NrnA [Elusimicrobia bacterium]|nr:bifunctional oligoribonuclease/PAP phosphatase NrnA [Elusimicrobiota bacterium]